MSNNFATNIFTKGKQIARNIFTVNIFAGDHFCVKYVCRNIKKELDKI